MSMSPVQLGLIILSFMVIIGIISYFIGLRKTDSAVKAAALGTVFAIVPVLGIIYVLYLAFKDDINQS